MNMNSRTATIIVLCVTVIDETEQESEFATPPIQRALKISLPWLPSMDVFQMDVFQTIR